MNNINDMAKAQSSESIYTNVRGYIINVQQQVYSAVNTAMVVAFSKILKNS